MMVTRTGRFAVSLMIQFIGSLVDPRAGLDMVHGKVLPAQAQIAGEWLNLRPVSWVGPKDGTEVSKKRKNSFSYREWNSGSSRP
jgi:hypothetical protein